MNLRDFESALDTFGGDLARWPEPQRRGAQKLLEQDDRARSMLYEAQALDQVLGPDEMPPANTAMVDRIMRRVADRAIDAKPVDETASDRSTFLGRAKTYLLWAIWPVPREFVAVGCGTLAGVLLAMYFNNYGSNSASGIDFLQLAAAYF